MNLSARSCSLLMRSTSSSCDDRVQARGRCSEATARSAEEEGGEGGRGRGGRWVETEINIPLPIFL